MKSNNIYTSDQLSGACDDIGIIDHTARLKFSKMVEHAGERYLTLTRLNSNRIVPSKQNKMLKAYGETLQLAQSQFREIEKYTTTSAKLSKAVRQEYEMVTDSGLKDMFSPYCNESSMAMTVFDNFLGLLSKAAINAPAQNIGNDKADLSGKFLTEWLAVIGKAWPTNSKITFALGKHHKELKGYSSLSIQICHTLMIVLDPTVTEKDIENSMRIVKHEDMLDKPVASFFVA